jgi:hypothetical protein
MPRIWQNGVLAAMVGAVDEWRSNIHYRHATEQSPVLMTGRLLVIVAGLHFGRRRQPAWLEARTLRRRNRDRSSSILEGQTQTALEVCANSALR